MILHTHVLHLLSNKWKRQKDMLTYEYNIYDSNRNKHLEKMLSESAFVWNHALALQRRYYRLYGSYVQIGRMKHHFAMHVRRRLLGSQTVHEILERLDNSYQRFFSRLSKRPPKFKKSSRFSSFVFKQAGFKLNSNILVINSIRRHFKFSYSRPYEGAVKQVRIKRCGDGNYSLYIVTDAAAHPYTKTHDGAYVGLDFGLKHFLTLSDGTVIDCPLFLKRHLKELRKISRALSGCQEGSGHWKILKKRIQKLHRKIANLRNDWQWKLAHELCRRYDNICIEDLNLTGMTRLWGRKVNDLAYGDFVSKLEHVCAKYGCRVIKVDRYYASSRICGRCGIRNDGLSLRDRSWTCPVCGAEHDRDVNAAVNIMRQGFASSGSPRKTKVTLR